MECEEQVCDAKCTRPSLSVGGLAPRLGIRWDFFSAERQ